MSSPPPWEDWNAWAERVICAKLTAEGSRLAWALGRLIIGYQVRAERLGDRLVRETAKLHGLSLPRARDELVEKGLIRFVPGERGRGKRGSYELLLDLPEKTAQERAFAETPEKTAEKTAQERSRRLEIGEKGQQLPTTTSHARGESGDVEDSSLKEGERRELPAEVARFIEEKGWSA